MIELVAYEASGSFTRGLIALFLMHIGARKGLTRTSIPRMDQQGPYVR